MPTKHAKQQPQAEPADIARVSLLRMGRVWQSAGMTSQALDVYERLLAEYPGTAEASEAASNVVLLAQTFEREGQYHRAMDLYAKLERLS